MSRRMLALALIAVFAAVLVGGCSDTKEETIEYTIRDFYAAYNAEDWDVCLGHIDDTNNVGASVIQSMLKMARAATGEVTVDSVTNITSLVHRPPPMSKSPLGVSRKPRSTRL